MALTSAVPRPPSPPASLVPPAIATDATCPASPISPSLSVLLLSIRELKTRLVELSTKRLFLRHILSSQPHPTPASLAQADLELFAAKKRLREVKQARSAALQQLHDVLERLEQEKTLCERECHCLSTEMTALSRMETVDGWKQSLQQQDMERIVSISHALNLEGKRDVMRTLETRKARMQMEVEINGRGRDHVLALQTRLSEIQEQRRRLEEKAVNKNQRARWMYLTKLATLRPHLMSIEKTVFSESGAQISLHVHDTRCVLHAELELGDDMTPRVSYAMLQPAVVRLGDLRGMTLPCAVRHVLASLSHSLSPSQ